MNAASIFMIMMSLLLLLLLLWAGREEEREAASPHEGMRCGPRESLHPQELVRRIFSRDDRDFVLQIQSARLHRMYQEERRKLALHWVRQTAGELQRVLSAHRLSSRQSADLKVSAEAGLFFRYLELRLLCGLLVVLIHMLGPHALQDMASYAGKLHQRISGALPSEAANPVASSESAGRP